MQNNPTKLPEVFLYEGHKVCVFCIVRGRRQHDPLVQLSDGSSIWGHSFTSVLLPNKRFWPPLLPASFPDGLDWIWDGGWEKECLPLGLGRKCRENSCQLTVEVGIPASLEQPVSFVENQVLYLLMTRNDHQPQLRRVNSFLIFKDARSVDHFDFYLAPPPFCISLNKGFLTHNGD